MTAINSFYWPNLKALTKSSEYLLIMDGSGNTMECGSLSSSLQKIPNGDNQKVIDRHMGVVNCLFADFHVDTYPQSRLEQQDKVSCSTPPGNSWFLMN